MCSSDLGCSSEMNTCGGCTGAPGATTCTSGTDNLQNGGESDVDCGGANDCIERCGLGATCTANADCDTGKCDSGTNQCRELTPTDTCVDGALNYMETDGDCGGAQCTMIGEVCALTEQCKAGTDCASGLCDTTVATPVCVSCSDGAKNGVETAVDCGGGVCDTCGDGGACVAATDCTSKQCEANECTSCVNGVKDGGETGVDCGGETCDQKCSVPDNCLADTDCATGRCNIGGCAQTAAVTCTDATTAGCQSDGAGGFEDACAALTDESSCLAVDADTNGATVDCAFAGGECMDEDQTPDAKIFEGFNDRARCEVETRVCRDATAAEICANGVQDNDETGVDCGGSKCPRVLAAGAGKCTDGTACLVGTDKVLCVVKSIHSLLGAVVLVWAKSSCRRPALSSLEVQMGQVLW